MRGPVAAMVDADAAKPAEGGTAAAAEGGA